MEKIDIQQIKDIVVDDVEQSIPEHFEDFKRRLDEFGEGDPTAQWDTLERQFSRLWSFMWGDEPDSDANDEDTRIGNSADPYELWFSEENTSIRLSIKVHGNEEKLVDTWLNPRQYMGSDHALTLGSGNYQFQYYTHPDECWHGYLYRTTAVDTDYDIVWQSYTSHNGSLQDQIEEIHDWIGQGDMGAHEDSLSKQLALINFALEGYERNCNTDDDTHIGDINDWYDMWLDSETDWLSIKIVDYLTNQVLVNRVFNPWQYEGYSRRLTLGYGNNQFEFYMEEDDGYNHGYLYRTTAPDKRYLLIADGFKNHNDSIQNQLDSITPDIEEIKDRINSFDNGEILGEDDSLEVNFAELYYKVSGKEPTEDYYNYGEEVVIGDGEDPYEIHFGEDTDFIVLRVGPTSSWPNSWIEMSFNPTLYTDGSELGIGNNLKYYTDEGRPGYGWLYRYTGEEISYTIKWKTFINHDATLQEQINDVREQTDQIDVLKEKFNRELYSENGRAFVIHQSFEEAAIDDLVVESSVVDNWYNLSCYWIDDYYDEEPVVGANVSAELIIRKANGDDQYKTLSGNVVSESSHSIFQGSVSNSFNSGGTIYSYYIDYRVDFTEQNFYIRFRPYGGTTEQQLIDYYGENVYLFFNRIRQGSKSNISPSFAETALDIIDYRGISNQNNLNKLGVDSLRNRLNEFNPDSTAAAGTIEKWASTVGLPSATSSDAYAYVKVDSNGDFVIQQPLNEDNNYGDEEFTGDLNNVPNAQIVQRLVQDSISSLSDSVDYRIGDAVGEVNSSVNSISSKVNAEIEYKVQEGNTVTETVTTQNMSPVPVIVNVDTSLISRGDVVCIYYPNRSASDFIKVGDYGTTPPSQGNVYPTDVVADNSEKTIISISVNAPHLEDYPIPVEVTVYQVEKKQLDANTFINVVDAYNQ